MSQLLQDYLPLVIFIGIAFVISGALMVAAHSGDLAQAAKCGLRTGHVARPNEHGPCTGERAPTLKVDVAAADLADLADKLGA